MLNRRELIRGGIGATAFVAVAGFGPPACKVSKDKAIRYTGYAIDYLEDIQPLLAQIGGQSVAALVAKAIPLLVKLKKALEDSDIPEAGNIFDAVISVLGQVATALLQLPDSPTRNTVIGILTLVQVTMRTISLFIKSEPSLSAASVPAAVNRAADAGAVRRAFEASRF